MITLTRILVLLAVVASAGCGSGNDGGTPEVPSSASPAVSPTATAARPSEPLRSDLAEHFQLIQQRRTGPARVRLKKHLTLHPHDGQAEFLFGLSYHREKRYNLARPYFESALEDAPRFLNTWYFYGWALYYLGEMEPARAAFLRHLQGQPDEGDTHFGLGLIDLDEDALEEAEQRFRRSIDLHSAIPGRDKAISKAHARLADVYIRRGEFERARDELLVATAMYPDHYEAFYKLFRVFMRLGEPERAEEARLQFQTARARLYPETRFPE